MISRANVFAKAKLDSVTVTVIRSNGLGLASYFNFSIFYEN